MGQDTAVGQEPAADRGKSEDIKTDSKVTVLSFAVPERGEVDALLLEPPDYDWLYVFGHGAGAGMSHRFMESAALGLASRRVATFRYQFPYMQAGRSRPDTPKVTTAAIRAAVDAATLSAPGARLAAGGKSFGGRLTSVAQAEDGLEGVEALVFFGFPLHAPGRPSDSRAAHLRSIEVPLLFLQGTRDNLASLDLLRPVVNSLGARARMHVVEGADHSFHMRKSSGRTDADVLEELCQVTAEWLKGL